MRAHAPLSSGDQAIVGTSRSADRSRHDVVVRTAALFLLLIVVGPAGSARAMDVGALAARIERRLVEATRCLGGVTHGTVIVELDYDVGSLDRGTALSATHGGDASEPVARCIARWIESIPGKDG